MNADQVLQVAGVADPVRVSYDDRGIPHIYGKSTTDVVFAQGYVTARDRMFQMHTLRSAAKGRLAELGNPKSLSGDIYLRALRLGSVAQEMAAATKDHDPELQAALEAFAAGVNAYLANMRAGREPRALEVAIFGEAILYEWTTADTMAIARLQTWDLGFGGVVDELALHDTIAGLLEAFPAGSPLEGIAYDVANFEPPVEVATNPPEGGAKQVPVWDLAAHMEKSRASGKGLSKTQRARMRKEQEELEQIPHHAFRGAGTEEWGSNNWVVSGAHTASGRPILANDTHLALRNPAVFYQVHVSTALAGGALDAQGVNFAGAPGIVLGHNAHAAWGATVFYDDVTDMYLETLDATKKNVRFKGAWVPLVERVETFRYVLPSGVTACVDAAPTYVAMLTHSATLGADGWCTLELTLLDVPHHGPVIPWSLEVNPDGTWAAVTWKWTGFEPTDELGAIWRLNTVTSWSDFKAALDRFGVGAQNWIFAGKDGDIGWYPSHLLPIRACYAGTATAYPPFLPMPGETGECEWEGFVPRADLPQAHNPAKGYLMTANADPVGVSFDGDPFDDLPYYLGYAWDIGFRAARVDERLKDLIGAGTKATRADMSAIQGDHKSALGTALVPTILAAVKKVKDGLAPEAAGLVTPAVEEAVTLLTTWQTLGFGAESGIGAAAGSDAAKASAATAIFNTFVVLLVPNLFEEDALISTKLGDSMLGRLLVRVFLRPETMRTYDAVAATSRLWDDARTSAVVETRETIVLATLAQAMAFLSDPAKVGVAQQGGFGTSDTAAWRWGLLHTVKFVNNVTPEFDVPSASVMPDGFPRHGDNFNVDANSIGLNNTNFTYSHGPAIRNVFELTDIVAFDGVVAGGQCENPTLPHYQDETEHWAKNEAPPEYYTPAAVLGARERTVDFITLSP